MAHALQSSTQMNDPSTYISPDRSAVLAYGLLASAAETAAAILPTELKGTQP
jgi:hypothetical protein